MAASVSYKINGKYDGKAISQAQSGMQGLADTAKKLSTVFVAAFAGQKVMQGLQASVKTFKENNKEQTRMFQSLSANVKTAQTDIKGLVKEFNNMSGLFSGSDLVKGGTLLSQMGLDEDQMRKTAKAAKDLAASGIMSLDQAFQSLGKSYSGNITQLKKLFPELSELTKEELEAGKAVELLSEKFAGMEDAVGGTFDGQITILKDKIDSIKDTIGTMGGFLMQSGFNDMSNFLDKISDVANKFMPSIAAWTTTIIHTFANFDIAKIFDPKTTFEAWKNMFEVMAKNFLAVFDFLKSKIQNVWSQNELDAAEDELKRAKEGRLALASKRRLSSTEQETLTGLNTTIAMLEADIEEQKQLMTVKGKTLAELMSEMVYNTGEGFKNNLSLITGEDMGAFYESQLIKYGQYENSNMVTGSGVVTGNGGTGDGTNKVTGGPIWGLGLEEQVKALKDTVMNSIGDIGTIIQSALDGSSIGVIIAMIGSAMSVIQEKTTVLTDVLGVFAAVFRSLFTPEFINMLNNFFGPIVHSISSLGRSLGLFLSVASEVLTPVLLLIAKGVDMIARVVETISTLVYNCYVAVYNAFNWRYQKDYKDMASIWDGFGSADYDGYNVTESSTSSAASYTAARDIYVTINFSHSYVNGDAREIAVALNKEMESARRMGYIE